MPVPRPSILCVDDDLGVLEGLSLHLRRRFDLSTALSGADGLALLERNPNIALVLSDMRMPGMNGAEFLSRVRTLVPDATRLLLTGQAELDSAIQAVNEGQIFRFLTKPCPPPQLLAAIEAGLQQHRLILAERELLEQTLHGSIKTLADVLALTSPVLFGRAMRIRQHASDLASALTMTDRWKVEVAAMLSQIGFISVPPETVERLRLGHALSESEQKMVAKAPSIAEHLLANIPRLEDVRDVLGACGRSYHPGNPSDEPRKRWIDRAGQILALAVDFDALEARGDAAPLAVETLRGRTGRYNPEALNALARIRGAGETSLEVREFPLAALHVGMVFADDVKMTTGALLVSRGYEVTAGFIERARNIRPGTAQEPVRVYFKSLSQALR